MVPVSAMLVVFGLAQRSSAQLDHYRNTTVVLAAAAGDIDASCAEVDARIGAYLASVEAAPATGEAVEAAFGLSSTPRNRIQGDLKQLAELAPASLAPQVSRLRIEVESYLALVDQAHSAAMAGDLPHGLALADQADRQASQHVVGAAAALSQDLDADSAAELDDLENRQRQVALIDWVAAGLTAGCLLAILAGLRRWVTRPLASLRSHLEQPNGAAEPWPGQGHGEIVGLADAYRRSLDALALTTRQAMNGRSDRELEIALGYESIRAAEQKVRGRAQQVVDDTSVWVTADLELVNEQVVLVRHAADVIDRRVGQADQVTLTVVRQARDADQVAAELHSSLGEVSGMASVIARIADQTKRLALNAAIEAARAGEAGRGFAVVAKEVKDLADSTARATGRIADTIGRLEAQADAMAQVLTTMGEGISSVNEATAALREVAAGQFTVVDTLDARVSQTMSRIQAMATLTSLLERRAFRRVPVTGYAEVSIGGRV